jgi:hypothetical protein
MTHDEAYSFLNIKRFWYAQFLCNANSHWINSFGMWLSSVLGFEKAWHLRWLSLASAGTFLICGYYWLRSFDKNAIRYFAFALAFLNPFTLDYFMMARGYASGMALEALSLLFFTVYLKNNHRRYALSALFFAGLSAIANFNFFYFYAGFLAVYFFTVHFRKDLSFLKERSFYCDAMISLAFILVVLRALLFIKRCSMDFTLGDENFIESVFASYLDGLMYSNARHKQFFIFGLIFFGLILTSLVCGIVFFNRHTNIVYYTSAIILTIALSLHVINHYCFGMLYPYYRGGLHLFPLLVLNLVYFFNYYLKGAFQAVLLYTLSVLLIFNFIRGIDFRTTIDFYHQSESKDCFELVEELGAEKVGLSHEHQGVYINYYQETDDYKFKFDGKLLNTYDADPNWKEKDKLQDFDFLILYPPYNLSYYKKREIHFEGVTVFPITGTVILKVLK